MSIMGHEEFDRHVAATRRIVPMAEYQRSLRLARWSERIAGAAIVLVVFVIAYFAAQYMR